MKKNTKKSLISLLCCGLMATTALGVTASVNAFADTVRVTPTGTKTETLTQEINDADLETFKVYGASTRKKEPNGFRFLATIEDSDLASIPNDAEFGTIIIPNSMLNGELTVDTANALVARAKVDTSAKEVPDNGIGYYITLMGETLESAFPQNLYGTVLAARAYVKYTYESNGETITDYAYSQETIKRSIAYVASCELTALENGGAGDADENSFLNKIISATTASATLTLSQTEFEIGQTATAFLDGVTDGVNNFAYALRSSNENVAVITDNGEIQTVGGGKATITAIIGAKEWSTQIFVEGERIPVLFADGNIMYSTADSTVFMPDGLLDEGETVISAVDAEDPAVDYFNKGKWAGLALTDEEIKSNLVRRKKVLLDTSDGDLYYVYANSYAGIIDELSDFPAFFNNTAVPSEFDPATYPAVAPNTYGYYIVTKDLGSYTGTDDKKVFADTLTFDQVEATDYKATNGFNGVLDGAGHTLKFKLAKGGLVGLVLGNAVIKNIAVIYEDASYEGDATKKGGYGVFGCITNGYPEIRNSYIERVNLVANRGSVLGIMGKPNAKLTLHNTLVYGFRVSNDATWYSNTWISAASTNAYVVGARVDAKVDMSAHQQVKNFTKVYAGGTGSDSDFRGVPLADIAAEMEAKENAKAFDTNYWAQENENLVWKGAADMAVSVYEGKYVEVLSDKWQYSERDGEMFFADGVIEGEIVNAYDENGVDYYENGAWQNLNLSEEQLKAKEIGESTITVETDAGYYYQVPVSIYAGIIDELSDFPKFFNNTAVASEFDPATYPAVAPNTYGYYIVTKDLGSATDELTFDQVEATDYQPTNGFNGVLDGQGHTLRFKLKKGGLVGLVLGNAVIKNIAVIYEDASMVTNDAGRWVSGAYGAFGYITNGAPEIRNSYIERTSNTGTNTSLYGIMARPNGRLILHNTVVYALSITKDCTMWKSVGDTINGTSTNAYVIHAKSGAENYGMSKNFSKVYLTDVTWDGSRHVPLADIKDVSKFDSNYWYKENGSLIWKGFTVATVTWVNGKTTTKQAVTRWNHISMPTLPDGMYWSTKEDGSDNISGAQKISNDITFYACATEVTLSENALYSTADKEFFLPTAVSADLDELTITSEDGETIYLENGVWKKSFALTSAQINENKVGETPVIITDGRIVYKATVKSYAGVIDELEDFPKFFNNTAVASEFDPATYPAVAPNTYGYYIVTKSLGDGSQTLNFTQTQATDYKPTNGFNGVLDGAGHTLHFKLNKGGLVGLVLGNAHIKNLAVKYEDVGIVTKYDSTKGYDVWVSDGYGVFGYVTNGAPTIENCYIEKTNNHYMGSTLFGIMARPNGRLVLKNTAVYANNTSNKASLWPNMFISSNSRNAYLIYARSNATNWTDNVKNFTEVKTDNVLTGDLSSFDANLWNTADNKLIWKGAADMAVSSQGVVEIESTFLKNGVSSYAIVRPSNADEYLVNASDELQYFFQKATGVTLKIVEDNNYTSEESLISIGDTRTFASSGVGMGEMNSQGYHIQLVDNTLYINSTTSLGCLYGVYDLLNELFHYEQYSSNIFTIDSVQDKELPEDWVNGYTESPDIEMRMPSNGAIIADKTYAKRMRMALGERDYLYMSGDHVNNVINPEDAVNEGWRVWHNTLEVLPKVYWTKKGYEEWFADSGLQLCYTAHGDKDAFDAMVAQIVRIMAQTLSSGQIATYPNAVYLTLTSEDGNGVCTCSACAAAKAQYGSDVGAVINLCNLVRAGLQTWMEQNPAYRRDDIKLLFYAYNDYIKAPNVGTITMDKNVGVVYAVSDYVNYYFDIYHDENKDFRAQFDAWADLANINKSPLCLWTYSKNFYMYLLRADVYGDNAFYNENAYQYFADAGVDFWFNQGAANGTSTLSAFEKLNGYIDSKMMWDSTLDTATLTENWFNAMYGAGAEYMKSLYAAQNTAARSLYGTTKKGIPSAYMDGGANGDDGHQRTKIKKVLTESVYNTWVGYIDSAKEAIINDHSLTEEQKEIYVENINEEWLSVEFLYVFTYKNSFLSANTSYQTKFREVLGYDSATGTYAKDVIIYERAQKTLTQWVDNNCKGDI